MNRYPLWLFALALATSAAAAPYEIKHLEPLNWWVGMKNPDLQLMVHGDKIAELTPELAYPGVTLTGVERTKNPNYLWVNLTIAPDTAPGALEIRFKRGADVVTRASYTLAARRPGSAARRGFDASDAVYLITPDRFANANPGNDSMPGLAEKADRTNPDGRHGGDVAGIRAHLDYIAKMGFTMIWPTPILENNQPEYSYHGYSITDNYHVDARMGTNEEYRDLVRDAHAQGLGMIQDIVLNHIGTGHWWMKDLPDSDWINYQSGFVPTNNEHTTVQDPHAAPEERQRFLDGWFVDTMPDLNQRNAHLARYLIQNSIWWVEYADLSGIREDTWSYSDPQFLVAWCKAVLAEYPHLNIVGEEMKGEPYRVAYWQKGVHNLDGYASELPSLMDFPIVDLISTDLPAKDTWNSGLNRIYETIAADYLYANPMNLMVFPDNHDRSRIFSVLHEDLNLLETALLFVGTTRGIPEYYYGTEVLTKSPIERNDGLLRADMPGGWAGDKVNAFTGAGLSKDQQEAQGYLRRLLSWRKTCPAVTAGKLLHYIPHDGYYVYFRYDDRHTVMVVLNKNAKGAPLDLARFQGMIKGAKAGRNVLTGETMDLTKPLQLAPMKSVAVELD